MNPGDWIFFYGTGAVNWLNPLVEIIGLWIAVWAFWRCRKPGYLVIALYFILAVFSLLAMPSINRAIRARRAPDVSAQTQQKIDAAVSQTVNQVQAQEGHPVLTAKRDVRFPVGPIVLVGGLWLLASREPQCRSEKVNEPTRLPNDEQPPT